MNRIYAIAVFLFFSACPLGHAAISFDSAATTSGDLSTFTWTHIVAGEDPALFVAAGIQNPGATSPITAVTYNGVPMTLARRDFITFQVVSELWYLANPDGGSNPVTIELDATEKMACGSISLNGVHQTDPVPTVNGNCNSSAEVGPVTVAITTAFDDSWLLDCMYLATASIPVTATSGQTERWQDNTTGASDASNSWGEGSTRSVGSAGSYDASWDWGTSKKWCLSVIEVREQPAVVADGQNLLRLYWRGDNSITAGTLAMWQFENNLVDKTGTYDLEAEGTGTAACYDQLSQPNLSYHLAADASDLNTCMHTNGNITGTVQTLIFYVQVQTGAIANSWLFDGDGGVNNCKVHANSDDFYFCFGGTYNWHPETDHTLDQWYGYAVTMDGVNIKIYKQSDVPFGSFVTVKDGSNTYQSVNKTWHFGNQAAHSLASDRHLDWIRLMSTVETVFPILD